MIDIGKVCIVVLTVFTICLFTLIKVTGQWDSSDFSFYCLMIACFIFLISSLRS